MALLTEEVRATTDKLDAVGNTTKAVTKGYAIASAALAALALFSDYLHKVGLTADKFSLFNPFVLVGLLLGGLLPFIFSAVTMRAVGKGAFKVVEEVRRQFSEIKGLWEGKAKTEASLMVDPPHIRFAFLAVALAHLQHDASGLSHPGGFGRIWADLGARLRIKNLER